MTIGFIYKIQFPNGKYYIGLTTTSLEQRRQEHKRSAKRGETQCLYKALRKYEMIDTFELIEIDTADTLEELCEMEITYITEYNSYYMNGKGYNMTFGGEGGTKGYIFTEEDKQKQSEIMKKYYENPDARKENSERLKKHYEENPHARKEHGERMKKYYENPDARKEHGERVKKYYETHPESRQQASKTTKKYYEEHPTAIQKVLDKKGKNKPFNAFTIDGTFIKTFTYQFEAMKYLQKEFCITSIIKISEVLAGNRCSSAGFVFKYN